MQTNDSVPFLSLSPYVTPPADLQPALSADVHADVAIVGGGLTGLSTALALKERGVNPVIIEKDFCGYGASGRNAGHLTPTICKDLPTAVTLFGSDRAGKLVRFADYCVENAESVMQRYGIDCDYSPSGNIMSVVHPAQEKRLRKATEIARSVGARVHFCEPGEMRERGIPGSFLCGSMEEAGGTLHPGKLVTGLRAAALRAGIRIFEQTAVTGVKSDDKTKVITDRGVVKTDTAVIASNAYTPEIGKPGNRIYPLLVTLFETAPLSDDQLRAIGGWAGREGIYTAHESMESYRLTAQRTIIGGSKGVKYFYGGRTEDHACEKNASSATVIRAFRERFPELDKLSISHTWSGWIGMTMNFLPAIGRFTGSQHVYHSAGYNGHGVAQAVSVGPLLADAIIGKPNEWLEVIAQKPAYLPPEPFRWLGIKALLGLLTSLDRYRDKRIPVKKQP